MSDQEQKYIPLEDCKTGKTYRLHSRNLRLGVYDGNQGFIGIRTKFSDRFLFTEYHWDQGAPYGTAKPLEEIAYDLDPLILLTDHLGSQCWYCRRPSEFKEWSVGERAQREQEDLYTGTGRWVRSDGGDDCPCEGQSVRATGLGNQALFAELERIEEQYPDERVGWS